MLGRTRAKPATKLTQDLITVVCQATPRIKIVSRTYAPISVVPGLPCSNDSGLTLLVRGAGSLVIMFLQICKGTGTRGRCDFDCAD